MRRPVPPAACGRNSTGIERTIQSRFTSAYNGSRVKVPAEGSRVGGLARPDPGPHARADPGGRPRDDRGSEVAEAVKRDGGGPGLVAPWDRLHRGDVHEGREAHLRPGGFSPRPVAP